MLVAAAVAGSAVLGHALGSRTGALTPASPRSVVVENPYRFGGAWYRGNLHIASVRGVGRDLPSAIGQWYAAHGYGFLGISDQNTYTWSTEYGTHAVVGVPTVGASYPFGDVLAIGVDHWLPAANVQAAVDWIGRDGGLAVLAAPLSPAKPQPSRAVLGLRGLFGLEVYDARLAAAGPGQGDATELWDQMLSAGHRVYAFAGDDLLSLDDPTAGQAWIDVLTPTLDLDSLLSSLRQGAFTASSGAEFIGFQVSGSTITAQAAPGTSLRFIGRDGRLLTSSANSVASYRVIGDEGYVRVEAIRDDGARAWSQPFFVSRR